MNEFVLVVIILVLLACVFVLFPLIRTRDTAQHSHRQINTVLFKARFEELSLERERGDLNDDEFTRLKIELERRLLEDIENKEEVTPFVAKYSRTIIVALLLFIPLTSWFIYGKTGAKADWDIAEVLKQARLTNAQGGDSSDLAKQLTQKLSARLQQKPDDPHYLMLLASTEMSLQNYPAATAAYQRMATIMPNDPGVLAQYAQALYLSSNRQMTGEVLKIIDSTLALQPNQPTVLGMLGIYNFEQGNYRVAINYWQRLLPLLDPASSNAIMIKQGIVQANTLLSKKEQRSEPLQERLATSVAEESTSAVEESTVTALKVNVSIDETMLAPKHAQVYVFARAVSGPKMPLAVARLTVADLPASITLDDSMAMTPSLKLSSFDQVEVVARVSKNGMANRGSGDMEGVIGPVTLHAIKGPLTLLINRILP